LGEEIRSKIRLNLPYASVNVFFVAKKGHVQEPRKDPVGINSAYPKRTKVAFVLHKSTNFFCLFKQTIILSIKIFVGLCYFNDIFKFNTLDNIIIYYQVLVTLNKSKAIY
jgi:hypothetical protein